jgi:hypothetical protein
MMLSFDNEAIDRIIDRCSPGGSDNRPAIRPDTAKAQHQFNLHAAAFLAESEKEEAQAYLGH